MHLRICQSSVRVYVRSAPHKSNDGKRPRTGGDAERDAKIESLLLAGLDHYFAADYAQAIDVWTRALFLDRNHARARAYIERARSAMAEQQRESEELLHNGIAAFERGEIEAARADVERGGAARRRARRGARVSHAHRSHQRGDAGTAGAASPPVRLPFRPRTVTRGSVADRWLGRGAVRDRCSSQPRASLSRRGIELARLVPALGNGAQDGLAPVQGRPGAADRPAKL